MGKKPSPAEDRIDEDVTIANMNVEGMPWYKKPQKEAPSSGQELLSRRETFRVIMGALKASLSVALGFIAMFGMLLLALTYFWRK